MHPLARKNRHPLSLAVHHAVQAKATALVIEQMVACRAVEAAPERREIDLGNGLTMGVELAERTIVRAKPKRIRVRSKPLTAADIVEGGVYVPKRGNDKTPNILVTEIDRAEAAEYGPLVLYRDGKVDDVQAANVEAFLALVSRRVS